MKNSDAKIVSSVANMILSPIVAIFAHFSQRGFISGRNFLANVLEIDVVSRIFASVFQMNFHGILRTYIFFMNFHHSMSFYKCL